MAEPIKAGDYLKLGELAFCAMNPQFAAPEQYEMYLEHFRKALCAAKFDNAVAASAVLQGRKIPKDAITGRVASPAFLQFQEMANAIANVLYYEANYRQTIELQSNSVSKQLRDLPNLLPPGKFLTVAQRELMNEAIRCIECGAYRAASVMCWNLAYDYIRQWVVDSRLADFNKGLRGVCPSKTPIARYDDFLDKDAPSERQVIDAMANQASGSIIGGKLHAHLVQYLDYRNQYAHASEKPATAAKTNAYVEHLIDIITAAPFA